MEILSINSTRGVLTVKWRDERGLAQVATPQAGCYFSNLDNVNRTAEDKFLPIHINHFRDWNQRRRSERESVECLTFLTTL